MRYTIEKEKEVKGLAKAGKSLDYIIANSGLPKKVICTWCPELRPHSDIIKQSVKQRYHFIFPDFEAKITTAFSPFITAEITDDEWENLCNTVYGVLFDLAFHVFANAISDLPNFSDKTKLCEEPFLQYCKNFWNYDKSDYIKSRNKGDKKISREYALSCYNVLHYWSSLKNKKVKDITKGDFQIIQEKLQEKKLSPSRIYFILRAGLTPLCYAQKNGLTLSNISDFKMPKKIKKQNKIPEELVEKLFKNKWDNELAYFANLLAYYGHLKLNELKALDVITLTGLTFPFKDPNYVCVRNEIEVPFILDNNDEIQVNKHKRSFKLPQKYFTELTYFITKNKYNCTERIFIDGKKRNTWNDELKKQAARYSDMEVNFAMWQN